MQEIFDFFCVQVANYTEDQTYPRLRNVDNGFSIQYWSANPP